VTVGGLRIRLFHDWVETEEPKMWYSTLQDDKKPIELHIQTNVGFDSYDATTDKTYYATANVVAGGSVLELESQDKAWRGSGGETIGTSLVSTARQEYRCKDCLRVIQIGELYYRRDKDETIYCMECYEPRRDRWLRQHDARDRKLSLLRDLRARSWTAGELISRYGSSYSRWIRDLKMAGEPIWRTRIGGEVVYHFQADELPENERKCKGCGRLVVARPEIITARRDLCPDCFASLGIFAAISNIGSQHSE
jgi:hypothetical protein